MASTSLEIQLTVNFWTQDDGYMKGQLTFSPALALSVTSYITRSYPNTQDGKIKHSGETNISYPMYNDGLVVLDSWLHFKRTSQERCLGSTDWISSGKWRKTSPLANSFGIEPHKYLLTTYPCLNDSKIKLIVFYNSKFSLKVKYKLCVNSSLINRTRNFRTKRHIAHFYQVNIVWPWSLHSKKVVWLVKQRNSVHTTRF